MAERQGRSGSPAIGDLSVVAAVTADLERIAQRDERLSQSPLAAMALELAAQLDDQHAEQACEECGHVQEWSRRWRNSATSKALVSKELRELLASLEVLAPAEKPKDGIDDLNERRRRKSRASG